MEWFTIISGLLLPMLAKCQSKTSTEDPQHLLRSKVNAETGRLDREVVRSAIPTTRRAVRKAWQQTPRDQRSDFPRYSRTEMYDLAEKTLVEAMNAPSEKVVEVMAAAASLPDENDE
jgi:hypothetical protein